MEISKLRATEMMLEETRNKLARIEEELNYAKEKIKTLKSDAACRGSISHKKGGIHD